LEFSNIYSEDVRLLKQTNRVDIDDKMIGVQIFITFYTVVKELRSKMFRQHPGCYQAVFLKKTQTIILSFDEYTVYIMF